mgnify:CR=1 FL=1
MVIVVLSGGLGSQLWQYSTGMSLANKKKCSLIVDAAWYNMKNKGFVDRRYLNFFELVDIKKKIIIKNIHLSRILRAFLILLDTISFGLIKYKKINISNPFKFEEITEGSNFFINGYPNNFNYFKDSYLDTLKSIKIDRINSKKIKIGLHARKGIDVQDFVIDFCNKDYYVRAVDKIIQQNNLDPKDVEINVFSENKQWCIENLLFKNIDTKIIIGDDKNAIDDMKMMMQCDHFVLPNSSFGWWAGAYVGYINKGTVVCPDLWWDRVSVKKFDVYPSSWVILETKFPENKNPMFQA